MPSIGPSDGRPAPVGQRFRDPFATLSDQLDAFDTYLRLVVDEPEQWMSELAEAILELPPEERFTDATGVVERRIADEFGSPEAFGSQLRRLDPEGVREFGERIADRLVEETLATLWHVRDGQDALVLSVGFAILGDGIARLDELDDEDSRTVWSSYLAYLARLYDSHSTENPNDRDRSVLVRDTARVNYHTYRAIGREPFVDDPEGADESDLRSSLRAAGAVLAYSRLQISVGRGAELADRSRSEFEDLLDQFGIEPRYGPESVADMYDDADGPGDE